MMLVDGDAQYVYNSEVDTDTHYLIGSDREVSVIVVDRNLFGLEVVQELAPSVEPEYDDSHLYTIDNYYSYVTKEASMCRFITMSHDRIEDRIGNISTDI